MSLTKVIIYLFITFSVLPLYPSALNTLDIVQSGYSVTLSAKSSKKSPLSINLELAKSEDSFLDYGLSLSYLKECEQENTLQGALSFNFTLVKQDIFVPISLYLNASLVASYTTSEALHTFEAFKSGIGYSGSIKIERAAFLSQRSYLIYGICVMNKRLTVTPESVILTNQSLLSSPYTIIYTDIGINVGVSRRPVNLNQGIAITYRASLIYSTENYFKVRFGVNFTSFKEEL